MPKKPRAVPPSPDPQSCASCRCWQAEPGAPAGTCKRYPPQAVAVADVLVSAFPSTERDDICGEYARRLHS